MQNEQMAETKKKIEVEIEAEYGSEFQEDFGTRSLSLMLQAWVTYLSGSHKKNNINVRIKEK